MLPNRFHRKAFSDFYSGVPLVRKAGCSNLGWLLAKEEEEDEESESRHEFAFEHSAVDLQSHPEIVFGEMKIIGGTCI